MNYIQLLINLGLTETEAKIYLANLELGPSSAIQLGGKLNYTRQLMYDLLPRLIESGYIKKITIGKKHYFQAVEPTILADKASQLGQEISKAIPLLEQTRSFNRAVPDITVYDNPLSMREWYRYFMDNAKKGEEKLVYSSEAGWFGLDQEFYQKFVNLQVKKDIKNKIIAPDNAGAKDVAKTFNPETFPYRFDSTGWQGECSKWIWRNQIIHLTVRGKQSNMIVIESEELANIERFAFYKTWESLK